MPVYGLTNPSSQLTRGRGVYTPVLVFCLGDNTISLCYQSISQLIFVSFLDHLTPICFWIDECVWQCVCVCLCVYLVSLLVCLTSHYLWYPFAPHPPYLAHALLCRCCSPKAWARDLAPCQTGLHENRQCCRSRVSELCFTLYVWFVCCNFFFSCFVLFIILTILLAFTLS